MGHAAFGVQHILQQRRVIASLASTTARALWQRAGGRSTNGSPPLSLPGQELVARVRPPSAALIRDYLRHVGGDSDAYSTGGRRTLPPHLFPQWSFPLAARTLRGLPYPLLRIVNGGCRLEVRAPLPADTPLEVRAQLVDISDNGRRAVLHQRIVTGVATAPDALVADIFAVVPSAGGRAGGGPVVGGSSGRAGAVVIPEHARDLACWRLSSDAGLAFAFLTGDFNPVHWLAPYARVLGFARPILHGFAMMARTMEALSRTRHAGAVSRISVLDVRFTRPLLLGVAVRLFLDGDNRSLYVGDAPGSRAYLTGSFEERVHA